MPFESSRPSESQLSLADERRALLRYARHLSSSTADADDLVQEALLRMWLHRPEFPTSGHQRAWLKRVVLNGRIDAARRARRLREGTARYLLEGAATPMIAPSDPRDGSELVVRNLHALPPPHRDVLLLVDVWEYSYEEAAATLACPIGTVMSRLYRARRALRARVELEDASLRDTGRVADALQASAA